MKILILSIITTFSIGISSCSKDGGGDDNGSTTTSTTSTTSTPVESDYRIKFQGNYNCKGDETFYSSDTSFPPVSTNKEFVLTVMRQDGVDSGMTFTSTNYSGSSNVLPDGTIDGGFSIVGRIVSPDSIYFNFNSSSHPGRTELKSKGKK
jgi:hypothetical protein